MRYLAGDSRISYDLVPLQADLLVTCAVIRRKDIIHVKDVIVILIVRSIVVTRLRWLCQNSSRVVAGFVLKGGIADTVCLS